jgi:hypothetical protein
MKDTMRSELSAARGRAIAHRLLLRQNITAAKDRLSPSELKRDVTYKLRAIGRDTRDGTVQTVRRHPYAIAAGAVTLAAFLLRKPIATVGPKVGHWLSERFADTRAALGGKDTRPSWWHGERLKRLFRRHGDSAPTQETPGD